MTCTIECRFATVSFCYFSSIGSIDAANAHMPVLGSGRSACSPTHIAHVGRRATSASMICSAETTHGHAHCLRRNKATNHSNDSPLFALSKCQLSNGVLLWTLPTPTSMWFLLTDNKACYRQLPCEAPLLATPDALL